MRATVFTIGHSRHTADQFMSLLRSHSIERLVDVRSQPSSKWAPHFGRASLEQLLGHSVDYVFLGRQLGGRPDGREFYRPDGTVDYARRALAPDFGDGISQLVRLSRDRRTAILCAEEDPVRCHRRLLVAPALARFDVAVTHIRHIRGDARLEPEVAVLEPTQQLDLFGG